MKKFNLPLFSINEYGISLNKFKRMSFKRKIFFLKFCNFKDNSFIERESKKIGKFFHILQRNTEFRFNRKILDYDYTDAEKLKDAFLKVLSLYRFSKVDKYSSVSINFS